MVSGEGIRIEGMIGALPDPESAARFIREFESRHPSDAARLKSSTGLLSDILTLSAFSPLLSTTLLQHPEYVWWLDRHRGGSRMPSKDELLESLARFSLTGDGAEPQVVLARFRRRELLRIFLRDVRRLATIAETTEEISNLADSVLEHSLAIATQELDNRYGAPLAADGRNRLARAGFCVVSLGKLGSRELNYSSDIDLLFLYSDEGATSGSGSRGSVTNREYFVKLSELLIKLVGGQAGEGAAYRVDMRLRPHGRVGPLALSVADALSYYRSEARDWERQVLIRSRASAGDAALFRRFAEEVLGSVYQAGQSPEDALVSVRTSKEKIDREHQHSKGFNVKLGRGGIREIEFIAQALQLAHGGGDRWLRASHTLISLARLADRGHISEAELNALYAAYDFLRETEHVLQMEHGLQTHIIPDEPFRRSLLAGRMGFKRPIAFEDALLLHTGNVSGVFERVFGSGAASEPIEPEEADLGEGTHETAADSSPLVRKVLASAAKDSRLFRVTGSDMDALELLAERAPHFAETVSANPELAAGLPSSGDEPAERDYLSELAEAVESETAYPRRLSELRRRWSRLLLEIVVHDARGDIDTVTAKRLQTRLAEASIDASLRTASDEMGRRLGIEMPALPVSILGLGKLGGRGVDYGSDLDIVAVYDESRPVPVADMTHTEFYSRLVETFTNTISSVTREGHLYRVDLRLRPDGRNGPAAVGRATIEDYFRDRAAIWEWLAYLKLRASGGDIRLGGKIENAVRSIIQERGLVTPWEELAGETRRIRARLEEERTAGLKPGEIDIKFGEGGLLDVYFATRCLQIRHGMPEDAADRSTGFTLRALRSGGLIDQDSFDNLSSGYEMLSAVDHTVRLAVGRSSRVSLTNNTATSAVCGLLGLSSPSELEQTLLAARRRVRDAFDRIVAA